MASLGLATLLLGTLPVQAEDNEKGGGVVLGTAESFGVVAASAITNTGASVITGDLGISPNNASSVTGFPPGIILGTSHFADGVALQAQNDITTAFTTLAGSPCGTTISADLGGSTLAPGTYCSGTSMGLTGTLTLDAQNDPNAVFIFQMGSTLTTASNSVVQVINGGQSCNVFWQVGSSATLGTGTRFLGSILAQDSISLTTGASISGRLLARTGAVTLDGSAVSVCALALPTAPGLSKAFSPSSINAGGISTLTVTLSNPNLAVATLTGPLVDNLPNGVVVAPLPNLVTTCGGAGAPLATAGASSVSLPAGRTIPANGSCTLAVDVTAASGGSYINTIPIGGLVTSNGNNPAPAIATLTVIPPGPNPPTLGKAFNPTSINPNGISTLTVTLSNPNLTVATLTSNLVDTLPSGVEVAPQPNVGTTCGGAGAPVAIAGGSTATLPAGRTIPANGSCVLSVDVTAALAGSYVNTLLAGALVTSNGNNPGPAVATLTVTAALLPPTLAKSFNPISINAGGISTLTVTLNNPNTSVATLTSSLVDTLPSGVVVAAQPNVATTCGGAGAPQAVAGSTSFSLPAGRSIAANGSCTLSVNVTAANPGVYVNTLPIGALVTSVGNNPAPALATLTVIAVLVTPAQAIPTASVWSLLLMASLLLVAGGLLLRHFSRH